MNRELSEQKKQLEEQRDKLEEQRDKVEEQRDQLIQLSHQLEEATHAKLVFFTNISHDFRTPLSIIIGQMKTLLLLQAFAPSIYNKLLNVYKNGIQLRELISELLDFRKQEQGLMKIKVRRLNLIDFLYEKY